MSSCKERRSSQVKGQHELAANKALLGLSLQQREALGAGVLWGRFWWCLPCGSSGKGWRLVVSSGGSWVVKVQETLGGASLSDGPGYLCENTGYF